METISMRRTRYVPVVLPILERFVSFRYHLFHIYRVTYRIFCPGVVLGVFGRK